MQAPTIEAENLPLSEGIEPVIEEIGEMEAKPEPEDPDPSLLKPKKARSEKQMEAFRKCQIARKAKLKNKKEMIKAVIEPVIIDNETVKPDEKKTDKKKRKKSKPTRVIYYGSDTESSEDERILYLPKSRARKPQPRVRTQFFEDEEPDYYSDEADDTANYNASYDQPPPPAETYYTQKFV